MGAAQWVRAGAQQKEHLYWLELPLFLDVATSYSLKGENCIFGADKLLRRCLGTSTKVEKNSTYA